MTPPPPLWTLLCAFTLLAPFLGKPDKLLLFDEDDYLEIKYESLLKYNQKVNVLTSETDGPINVDMPSTLLSKRYSEVNPGNKKPTLTLDIEQVVDSYDIARQVVYLYKNTDNGENMALFVELEAGRTFTSKVFVLAPEMYDCQKVFLFEEQIFAGCISELDDNVQICHLNFRLGTLSECNLYSLDYNLPQDQSLKDQVLDMGLFISTNQETPIFVFNFVESNLSSLKNRFFLVGSVRGNFSLEIPVDDIVLHSVRVLKCDVSDSQCLWVLSHREADLLTLVSFKTERFIINRDSLSKGLIKERIDHFQIAGYLLVLYELVTDPNTLLRVTQLNLRDMSRKEYSIEDQVKIVHTDFSSRFIMTLSETHNQNTNVHFINVNTGRLFESPIGFPKIKFNMILLEYDNHDFLWTFAHAHEEPDFDLYSLRDYDSLKLSFDHDLYNSYTEEEKKKYQIESDAITPTITGTVTFSVAGIHEATYEFRFLPSDFRINLNPQTVLERRILKKTVQPLPIKGNQLIFETDSKNVHYFNEIPVGASLSSQIVSFLKDRQLAFTAALDEFFVFSLGGQMLFGDLDLLHSRTNLMQLEQGEVINLFSLFEPDAVLSLEHHIVFSKFLIVLVQERRLFFADISQQRPEPSQITFKELDTPESKNCTLQNQLLTCVDPDSLDAVFYKYHMVDFELTLNLVTSMTPNLWRLVDPRLFFFTEFYYDSFYALYETNEGREIVVTHGQEVYGSYRVPFFQKQDPKDIFFEQITKYTTIYLLTSPSEHHPEREIEIYITHHFSIWNYPASDFLIGYRDPVGLFLRKGLELFSFVYRTNNDQVRAIFFRLSRNPVGRIVQETLLDKNGCAPKQINLLFWENPIEKEIKVIYTCLSTGNTRVFNFEAVLGVSLELWPYKSRYQAHSTDGDIDLNFTVNLPEVVFNLENEISSSEIVLNEEIASRQYYDLEQNLDLKVEGPVADAFPAVVSPNIEWMGRVRHVNSELLNHERQITFSPLLSLWVNIEFSMDVDNANPEGNWRTNGVRAVTNELILSGSNIQNNNFYHQCVTPQLLHTQEMITLTRYGRFSEAVLCRNRENQEFVLTDFKRMKLQLPFSLAFEKVFYAVLAKIRNFVYLIVQSPGLAGVNIFKFSLTSQVERPLKLVFMKLVKLEAVETWAGELETFLAIYDSEKDRLCLVLKEANTGNFQFKMISVVENYVNLKETQVVRYFGEEINRNLMVSFWRNLNNEIIILATESNHRYVLKISCDQDWKIETLYQVDATFSVGQFPPPMAWIQDSYLAVVNTPRNIDLSLDWDMTHPIVSVYKLNKEDKSGVLYSALVLKDFEREHGQFFNVQDLTLIKEIEKAPDSARDPDSVSPHATPFKMYLMCLGAQGHDEETMHRHDQLQIHQFEIGRFGFWYFFQNNRYKDKISVMFVDPLGQSVVKDISLVIVKNARLYIYIIVDAGLFLIFIVLILVTFCVYRAKKRRMMESLLEDDSMLTNTRSFAV